MWILWFICAVLLIIAVIALIKPLFKTYSESELVESQKHEDQRKALNIELYEQKKVQIEQDFANELLDDEAKKQAYNEIEHSLIQDAALSQSAELVQISNVSAKKLSIFFMLFVPLFSIAVYAFIMPKNLQQVVLAVPVEHSQQKGQAPDIGEMITSLEGKLIKDPDSIQGWNMLGRSYMVTKRYAESVSAYEKVIELKKTSDEVIVDLEINYVEALMQTGENQNYIKSANVLNSLLKVNPDDGDALWLKGFIDYEMGNKTATVKTWNHLLTLLPPGGEQANIVNTYLQHIVAELNEELPADKQIIADNITARQTQKPAPTAKGPALGQKMTGSKEEHTFIAAMVSRVEARVKENPGDISSWKKLAKSYSVLGRSTDSANAYAKAIVLGDDNVDLLMTYSNTVIETGEVNQLDNARILFAQLLDKNNNNLDVLFLSGLLANAAGDIEDAKALWSKLLPLLDKDSPAYKNVKNNLQSLQ